MKKVAEAYRNRGAGQFSPDQRPYAFFQNSHNNRYGNVCEGSAKLYPKHAVEFQIFDEIDRADILQSG